MPTPTTWPARKFPHQLTRRLSILCTERLRLAIKLLLGTVFVVLGMVACNGVSSRDPVTARPESRAAENSVAATSVGHPGPLPPDLGDLGQLRTLQLNHNQYTGPIPPELAELKELRVLDLRSNALTGRIPPGLGQLTELSRLDLPDNHLTGPIPVELAQLKSLEVLLLGGNPLTGCIPLELARLEFAESDLRNLGLPNCESQGEACCCE